MFKLQSAYQPAGDQIEAIKKIIASFSQGEKNITLMGATGTGKTFTMANVIQSLQKPTLVISHNKTLAAQLATEFKHFFPNNAVHYFVSYFDYYQPEAYLPEKDSYIEKEATVNTEIEMYRLGTMASLLSRSDVIVVASVSALYGLGQKEFFEKYSATFEVGQRYDFNEIKRKLIAMQYKPVQSNIEPGMFDIRGEIVDIFSSIERVVYRLHFNDDLLEHIAVKDSMSFRETGHVQRALIWPSTQYLQDLSDLENILNAIENEMNSRCDEFKKAGKLVEEQRLRKRVSYDVRMIRELGFVNGIENYSPYFEKRMPGTPPNTIFDYFPDDMLVIMDESHMSVPQMRAMPQADKSRKAVLIDHGFRLPSASDHRPLNFAELEKTLGWFSPPSKTPLRPLDTSPQGGDTPDNSRGEGKRKAKTLFVSATPAKYEIEMSSTIVEQIIRPTGLIDPFAYIYPKSGDYGLLQQSIRDLLKKKPGLQKFFEGYDQDVNLAEVFHEKVS